jgi:hypothetical protein
VPFEQGNNFSVSILCETIPVPTKAQGSSIISGRPDRQ